MSDLTPRVQGAGLRVIGFQDAAKRLQQLQDQKAVGNPMKDEGVNLTLTVSHGFVILQFHSRVHLELSHFYIFLHAFFKDVWLWSGFCIRGFCRRWSQMVCG